MDPTFEVIRFQVSPAGGAVAVIELEGRPADPQALSARPVLLLEGPVERAELQAIVEPDGVADGVVRASFAAPLELAVDSATVYALAIGRGPLLDLPAPDGAGDASLEVRLARTVNALRAELHETRERLGAQAGVTREQLAEHEERAARELAAVREDAEAARREAEEVAVQERAEAQATAEERDRLEAELQDARAEADELREELAQARARIGALEAAASANRVPRGPRYPPPPRRRQPRPPRDDPETEEHEHVPRSHHASLGRTAVFGAILVLVALLLAAIAVFALEVRVV